MNGKTTKLMTLFTLALTVCLFSSEHTTSALSARSNCKNVNGTLSEVGNPTGTTGRITKGGILNGTTQLFYTSGVLATPDPSAFSYTTDVTITTNKGQLKTSNVGVFDMETGLLRFSEIGRIDPNNSTGKFAGATGVLFTNGKSMDGGGTFQSTISGEICLAHDVDRDEDENNDNQ